MFGVSLEQLLEVDKHHATLFAALSTLLVRKGIVTEKEISDAIISATAMVDQGYAERQEQARREFAEEHPALAKLLDKLS